MASRKRALLEPTDEWQQLQFQLDWPEQTRYELIRPVVVFGSPPVERAQQTGASAQDPTAQPKNSPYPVAEAASPKFISQGVSAVVHSRWSAI